MFVKPYVLISICLFIYLLHNTVFIYHIIPHLFILQHSIGLCVYYTCDFQSITQKTLFVFTGSVVLFIQMHHNVASSFTSQILRVSGESSNSFRGEKGDTIGKINVHGYLTVCLTVCGLLHSHMPNHNLISSPPGYKSNGYLYGSGATSQQNDILYYCDFFFFFFCLLLHLSCGRPGKVGLVNRPPSWISVVLRVIHVALSKQMRGQAPEWFEKRK